MDLLNSREGKYILVILALGGLLWGAGRRIAELDAALAARPATFDSQVDDRTEDVRRGPIKRTTTTTTAPDGTKTRTAVVEIASEERHIEATRAKEHHEAPAQARPRARYVGLGVDPLNYARLPRLRAGVTLWSVLDAGVAYDARLPVTGGAFQLEATYRF